MNFNNRRGKMKKFSYILTILLVLTTNMALIAIGSGTSQGNIKPKATWQSPPDDLLKILHAPHYFYSWIAPSGKYMLVADAILYPPLAEFAAPMHKLAGIRVNPNTNNYHGQHGGVSPRLIRVSDGKTISLNLPKSAEIQGIKWSADGKRFALIVGYPDHIGLWIGSVKGSVAEVLDTLLNPLMSSTVSWLPDQKRLLIHRIPSRGSAPKAPAIPAGPEILEGSGAAARSTYEARNLLKTAHDDALFKYYTTSELVIYDPASGKGEVIGKPDIYTIADFSPDGKYLLIQRLVPPWSHEVACWRFASEIEVWNDKGKLISKIASLPLANQVPTHGVAMGPRSVSWRPTAPHTLFWVEALDKGNPVAKVTHRDRLMSLKAPFKSKPKEVFKAKHRIQTWMNSWGEKSGLLMLTQRERIRRWRYVWLLDVDKGTSRLWYDLNENDRYGDPGSPLHRILPNGQRVLRQKGKAVYFNGGGSTPQGDRPFLDLRYLDTGKTKRLFRCDPNRYEFFVGFSGNENQFILLSESPKDMSNYYLASFGKEIKAEQGEATRLLTRAPITRFKDPAPQLRQIEKRIVKYMLRFNQAER